MNDEHVDIIEQASIDIDKHRADKEIYGDSLTALYIENIISAAKFALSRMGLNDEQINKVNWEDL